MAQTALDVVDDRLRDVIQNLFEIQSAVHGYLGPETQQELVRKISQLSNSLSSLSTSASNLPTQIPPEIIDYVEDGRNPDIYTREFVELAQKGNQYLKGKSEAFAAFRDVLAEEIVRAMPEMKAEVGRVMAGRVEEEQKNQNGGTQIS
ncbi:RNA polymerase II mediator complex subunit [Toensbergia leucococca]|nr:RNA polymerase II mediator complex subunit [Toensbergia leucococca]